MAFRRAPSAADFLLRIAMPTSKNKLSCLAILGAFSSGAMAFILAWTLYCAGPATRRAGSGSDVVIVLFVYGLPVVALVGGVSAIAVAYAFRGTTYAAPLKYVAFLVSIAGVLFIALRLIQGSLL
jgi:hypothetical protein